MQVLIFGLIVLAGLISVTLYKDWKSIIPKCLAVGVFFFISCYSIAFFNSILGHPVEMMPPDKSTLIALDVNYDDKKVYVWAYQPSQNVPTSYIIELTNENVEAFNKAKSRLKDGAVIQFNTTEKGSKDGDRSQTNQEGYLAPFLKVVPPPPSNLKE